MSWGTKEMTWHPGQHTELQVSCISYSVSFQFFIKTAKQNWLVYTTVTAPDYSHLKNNFLVHILAGKNVQKQEQKCRNRMPKSMQRR